MFMLMVCMLGMIGCSDLDEFSESFQRGGSFPIQKIMLQIFAVIFRENNDEFSQKKGGGVTPNRKISVQN